MGAFANLDGGPWLEKKLYTWEQLGWAKGNGHSGRSDVGKDSMPATRPEIWPKLLFRGSWIEVPKKYYNYLAEVKKSEINQKYKISEIALITELLLLLLTTT